MKHPAVTLLEALLDGRRVKIGDYTYVMGDNNEVCWVGTTDGGEERYMVVLGQDIKWFVETAERMTDEEKRGLTADMVISRARAGRRR